MPKGMRFQQYRPKGLRVEGGQLTGFLVQFDVPEPITDVCYGKQSGMLEFRQNIIERWTWVMASFQGFIQRLWVETDSQCAVRIFLL